MLKISFPIFSQLSQKLEYLAAMKSAEYPSVLQLMNARAGYFFKANAGALQPWACLIFLLPLNQDWCWIFSQVA